MTDLLTKLVNKLPPSARSLLLVATLVGLATLGWARLDWHPAMSALDARVVVLESLTSDTRRDIDGMKRWMCYQNWDDAMKSGIPCHVIVGVRP